MQQTFRPVATAAPAAVPPRGPTTRRWYAVAAGLGALAALGAGSLLIGSQPTTPAQVAAAVLHPGHDTDRAAIYVRDYRVPRTLLAVQAGAALGIAGSLVRAVTRNPLAGPGILGVNSGATASVVVGITAFGAAGTTGYVWFACAGAALTALLVFAIGNRVSGAGGPARLVLVGAAVGAVLRSATAAVTLLNAESLEKYRFWAVGSVADRGFAPLHVLLPCLLAGGALALALAPAHNAAELGRDTAVGLGVRTGRLTVLSGIAVTVLCGAATAAAGPIAFVGLIVSHAARSAAGPDHRWILPLAGVFGADLLLASDIAGRIVAPPGEVPAGVVTAVLGAAGFVVLLRHRGPHRRGPSGRRTAPPAAPVRTGQPRG